MMISARTNVRMPPGENENRMKIQRSMGDNGERQKIVQNREFGCVIRAEMRTESKYDPCEKTICNFKNYWVGNFE